MEGYALNSYGKVSIIVPVYNVDKYLDTCIGSIVGQTYQNLEIILVDDGSNDHSPMICDQWKERDVRIKVFHKQNGGLSDARNFGMRNAVGEYLMFVDSDDWIDPCTVDHAVSVAQHDGSDIVFWPYIREAASAKQQVHFFQASRKFEKQDVQCVLVRKLFGPYGDEVNRPEQMDWCSTAWGKLYKSSLIMDNPIFFVDLKAIGTLEDGLFNISAFSKAHAVSYLDCNYYHYRRTQTGQLTSTYKPDFYNQTNHLYYLMDQLCDELGDGENATALRNRVAIGMSAQALNASRGNASIVSKVALLKEILGSARYRDALDTLNISGMQSHWKMFYFCCKKRLAISVYLLACMMNWIKEKRNG